MKIEMHVHTSEGSSCAKAEAQEIVKAYGEAGYDAIVITNHFDPLLLQEFGETDEQKIERYLLGYRKAREAGKRYGVKVMFGVEIRLEPGVEDFLIYGIDEEFLFQNPNLCFLSQSFIRRIRFGSRVFHSVRNISTVWSITSARTVGITMKNWMCGGRTIRS